ncbi:TPA: prepilin peptidase [Streptococcus agalactiae]
MIMSTIYFISLCMSFILSYYDIKYQEYPIFLWILFTISTIVLTPITKVSIVLCLFGILAEVVEINIGSGDFLYLATIGLSLPLHQMLFIIQIGAWLGIIYCLVMRKMKKTIAFLPFLSIAYIIVTSYSLLF